MPITPSVRSADTSPIKGEDIVRVRSAVLSDGLKRSRPDERSDIARLSGREGGQGMTREGMAALSAPSPWGSQGEQPPAAKARLPRRKRGTD
jgi:hypothetical protein